MSYKNQHRLKEKKVEKFHEELMRKLGTSFFNEKDDVDIGDSDHGKVLLIGGKPIATFFDNEVFPTINGLLKIQPQRAFVTVDMGAVRFVYNGADIMAPGVVDADLEIKEGDLIWVRDENHGKPLAVGRALSDGKTMVDSSKGKVVKTLHHLGDGKY
ncbi:MAG: RNA-binding protein [Thermoplasmata archaeon]